MRAIRRESCFTPGTQTVSFDTARRVAAALAQPLNRSEDVPLALAVGPILAAAIKTPRALPPFDPAAMGGYAVCLSDA